jgi:hypothetical protein
MAKDETSLKPKLLDVQPHRPGEPMPGARARGDERGGGPGELDAQLVAALRPLLARYSRDVEARRQNILRVLALGVTAARDTGMSAERLGETIRQIWEASGSRSVLLQ